MLKGKHWGTVVCFWVQESSDVWECLVESAALMAVIPQVTLCWVCSPTPLS